MPWNWADGAGKQIYIALMEVVSAIIDIAKEISNNHQGINFIFISAFPKYAFNSLEVYPIDFITKSLNLFRLEKSTQNLVKEKIVEGLIM